MIYRPIEDLPPRPNSTEPAAVAGQLLFPWRATGSRQTLTQMALTTSPNGFGGCIIAERKAVAPAQLRAPDFEQVLDFYLTGGAVPPNLEISGADQLENDLNNMACCAGWVVRSQVCHIKLPGRQSTVWARAFLGKTQGGQFDGRGTLLLYCPGWGEAVPRTARFAICQHEKVAGSGADPMRGWHPGACVKCGLNMTVDSGD